SAPLRTDRRITENAEALSGRPARLTPSGARSIFGAALRWLVLRAENGALHGSRTPHRAMTAPTAAECGEEAAMPEATDTLITPELRAQLGVEASRRVSHPVDKSAIRMWAINIRWPEPPPRLYWDEEFAAASRWGGIIAPPYFNPFTYQMDEERAKGPSTRGLLTTDRGARGMNGGGEAEYGVPIRPGDIITETTKLADLTERQTSLGLTLFVVNETRWTNQRGELVRLYRSTGIRY
ncbi:MAG: MaoC family dehydratase N-terminal domain-containing protein, partial [Chloroflexi bacterium]|nr:MaoC family dehydratase N-terminal domain-containing protein [Chloroflexota bacterium]